MALTGLTPIQITNLNVSGIATFEQEVGVGGTLTYQDVTNVDAIGIITARAGVNVSAGQLDVGNNIKIGNAGVATAVNFITGVSNLHNVGLTLSGGQIDVGSNIKIGNAGVVTATAFHGDISNATGAAAGLGTALSSTQTSPLNKLYYTNRVLSVGSTITVDHPASATGAYTQYADIQVEDDADLIVADGDDLIPDILGLGGNGTTGAGGAGRLLVDNIVNRSGSGAPTFPNGAVVSGVVTATSFVGSGANLTSLPAQATIANNADNRVITGGSGVNLNGEANLTYDGSALTILSSANQADGLIIHNTNNSQAHADAAVMISGGDNASAFLRLENNSQKFEIIKDANHNLTVEDDGTERLRITSGGKLGINYAGTPPSEDVMICTAGQASPAGLTLSHLSGGNRYGARLQTISGTNKGLIISELFNSSYSALAKVNTEFGLKADNTCKTWLCYRSEAGNEGIIDDFNVASVNDEGTGSFAVTLDRNIHRHGNGWSQSIVFGCYNDGSRQLIAGVGYAPSHGSNNPWWDVEDNFVRVNTQRSTDGVKVDAKVFNMAMFGDTGDLDPA